MKLVNAIGFTFLVGLQLMADTSMVKTMAQMEEGLSSVQKGFLYNDTALIRDGVKTIHAANALFQNMEATKKYLPKDKQYMSNVAFNASARIDKASGNLLKALDKKQISKASQSYSEIVNACTSCHGVVRGW